MSCRIRHRRRHRVQSHRAVVQFCVLCVKSLDEETRMTPPSAGGDIRASPFLPPFPAPPMLGLPFACVRRPRNEFKSLLQKSRSSSYPLSQEAPAGLALRQRFRRIVLTQLHGFAHAHTGGEPFEKTKGSNQNTPKLINICPRSQSYAFNRTRRPPLHEVDTSHTLWKQMHITPDTLEKKAHEYCHVSHFEARAQRVGLPRSAHQK